MRQEQFDEEFANTYLVSLWEGFFGRRIDLLSQHDEFPDKFKNDFFNFEWNQVYDFFEYLLHEYSGFYLNYYLEKNINRVLERESSAYRLINEIFVPIINESETKEIQGAIDETDKNVSEHLRKALKYFADRESPDYHNSIKESISAVESMSRIITKEKKKTLSKALEKMEKDKIIDLHPALKEGFDKIYGWTSDEGGIRHGFGFGEGKDVGFEDAKFMLVAASAFVNYLKEKAIRAGVDLKE